MCLGNARIALQNHATGLSCPLSCFSNSAENQMQGKWNNSLTTASWMDVVLGRGWEEKFLPCGCLVVLKVGAHPVLPLHVLACELQKHLICFLFPSRCCTKIWTPYPLQAPLCHGWGERDWGEFCSNYCSLTGRMHWAYLCYIWSPLTFLLINVIWMSVILDKFWPKIILLIPQYLFS